MNNIKLLNELGFNGNVDKNNKGNNNDVKNKEIIVSFDKILFQSIKKISGGHFCIFGSKPFRYTDYSR